MSTRFSWPVCNRPAGDYQVVANAVVLGRPFRQPLSLPDASQFSDGLELWLQGGTDAVHLVACFRSLIAFHPATATSPIVLRLAPDPAATAPALTRLNQLEPVPTSFDYVNADEPSVRAAMEKVITDAYASTPGVNQSLWHPVMRLKWGNQTYKQKLDATPAAGRAAVIADMVQRWIERSATQSGARLAVLAGDGIGDAAPAFGGAAPPPGCPFAGNARQLVFRLNERCEQVRNPMSDVWTWVNDSKKASPQITLGAPDNAGQAYPHPIVAVTGLSLLPPKPPPRVETIAPLRPIPAKTIAAWHTRANATPSARIEWRVDGQLRLEARLIQGQPAPVPTLASTTFNALVSTTWTRFGQDISDAARAFQVPCELVVAFLGKETGNLDELAARFEPVNEAERLNQDQALIGTLPYDDLARLYKAVVPASGISRNVPDPWNDGTVIRTVGSDTFTWGQMADLLAISPYFRTRISPGLMQTLIDTAARTLDWVGNIFRDINDTYGTASYPNWWSYFAVRQQPGTSNMDEYLRPPAGETRGWLLVPRHSIIAGTAYVRRRYNLDAEGTFWDPPKAAAAYNAGKVRNPCGLAGQTVAVQNDRRTWGMCYYGDYMSRYAQVYNSAIALFDGATPPVPAPPVRINL